MALTSLNPNLLGTDSAGASKLSTTGGLVQLHSTGQFVVANNSANSFYVSNTGLVGIGTQGPENYSARVAIASSNGTNETIPLTLVNSNASSNTAVSLGFAPNVNIDLARITALRTDTGGGGATDLQFKTYNGSSLTEKARVTANGNVGINNSTPAVLANTVQIAIKANVNGDSMFVAQNSNGLTTAKFGFQYSGGVDNPAIGSYSDHPLVFLTNNTEKMRIAADGQLYHNVSYLLGSSYNAYHGKTSTSTNVVSGSFTDTGLVVASVYIPTNVRKVFAWIHFTLRSNSLTTNHTGVRFKVVRASDSNITYVGNGSWGFGITQTINNTGHATVTQFVNLYDYDSSGNQAGLTAGQTYSFTLQATDAFASGGQLRFAGEAGGTHENYTPAHATIWVL